MQQACRIIGVLDNGAAGLPAQMLEYIQQADVVIGATRTLKLFNGFISTHSKQCDLSGNLTNVPKWINQAHNASRHVVVLATGDPLCFGIAKYLLAKLGHNACKVYPNISTIQLACAKLGLTWQDTRICSVHSKNTGEWISGSESTHGLYHLLQLIQQQQQLAIFTSPENSPDRIARMLLNEGFADDFTLTVMQQLLQDKESITEPLSISDAALQNFSHPNIVLLQRKQATVYPVLFGKTDFEFKQRKPDKGLITKREVRAVSLARLQLTHYSVVWDIGAGSGAVGLEAARLCFKGHIYAIEKNQADFEIAKENRKQQRICNYTLVNAKAPEKLEQWPDPNAIFIGGSGGELSELIQLCLSRLQTNGYLVMNFVCIENMSTAVECLKDQHANWDVTQLSACRSKPILHMNRLQAENPVWIITAQKGEK